MVSIVLSSTQVRQIIAQEQEGARPPTDPGLPSARPADYVPPPAAADVTRTFNSYWNADFMENLNGLGVRFGDLSQQGLWDVRIIRASDYVVFGATKWGDQQALTLNKLSAEKARWSGAGHGDILARLNALQNVNDNDFLWIPERIRYETIYDQPWVAGDYILEVIDERGQVLNVTFSQLANPFPTVGIKFYTAQAGTTRRVFCPHV